MVPPCTLCQSSALTDAARTFTSKRPAASAGLEISRTWSTSAEPSPSWTSAFMVVVPCGATTDFTFALPNRPTVAYRCEWGVNDHRRVGARAARIMNGRPD